MFCEQCGTKVEDGQPFCPNCGNRVGSAAPAPGAAAAHAPDKNLLRLPSFGGRADKFNGMEKMEQLYYAITACLLVVCFILSLLKVYAVKYLGTTTAFSLADGAAWLLVISNILFTLCITFTVLEYMDKLSGLWIRFFVAASAALILVLFVIKWISGVEGIGIRLSVGGWFFLILQAGLAASAVLLLLEKLKKKK